MKESGQDGEEPVEMTDSNDGSQSEWADLRQWQQSDSELGLIIRCRLESDTRPPCSEMSPESEQSKRLWNQWDQLEIHNGLVYRRYTGSGSNDEYKQLLVPRCCVENVLYGHGGWAFRSVKNLVSSETSFSLGDLEN